MRDMKSTSYTIYDVFITWRTGNEMRIRDGIRRRDALEEAKEQRLNPAVAEVYLVKRNVTTKIIKTWKNKEPK